KAVPRRAHAGFGPPADRPDPLALVDRQNATRLAEIVPVRWGRMAQSPFGWLRGSPVVMTADLAGTPTTDLTVQLCGDAHLLNFGLYGAPDRRQVFDVNDFDETLAGPFEWDVKRLAASAVVAARTAGFADDVAARAARAAVTSYRTHMAGYARERVLDVWYEVIDVDEAEATVRPERPATLERRADKARRQTSLSVLPKLAEITGEGPRLRDHPPLVQRLGDPAVIEVVTDLVERYRASVADELHPLVDRFTLLDLALKVVGVGSVGTRCFVALLDAAGDGADPLFLQVKEAQPSVLEAHLPASPYASSGERVVRGQRMVQATSDILLGWFDAFGHSYYVRQLRDMKASVDLTVIAPEPFVRYCALCGWVLARAHARTGDPVALTGYLGSGTVFDEAIAAFATDYAAVAEADHARLVTAVAAGDIEVVDA
ncbi:MAG TPA: DUF2252 domain-containing protein, partial [Acidimicrobiales bacterium]|nr:DUF2252 domain-containing protein [Acidimicrobiales bacterium]